LEKLQKGAEKLKAVGTKFLEDQKNIDKIQEKQQRTRAGAEKPGGRVIPSLGAPQTPKYDADSFTLFFSCGFTDTRVARPTGSASQRSRLASLLK
jgi:hypothetical protein